MEFEDRAVAFLDILGFKELVNVAADSDDRAQELKDLLKLLESAVPDLNATVSRDIPARLIPRHIYISDCIILSSPLQDSAYPYYDGLAIIIMRVIQISHHFLSSGYLLRGGIAIGKTWHSESNIVGPGYQEALELEKGKEPIVVLSKEAAMRWRGDSRMCLSDNGKVFVNSLFDYYIPNSSHHGEIERTYSRYMELVDQRLTQDLPPPAREKWAWFKTFLRSEAPEGLKWARANSNRT